ncbi:DUF2680 domain-containing protein [Aquibacillus saliphilus]|uniref:DUF2680 domain-containing protein n=1 Tax=Aquibacillus saliphilus TaxID=1909422 RepID=UPI001CF00EFE|nr:DUF2680 domain-containing protein [Aquibacillus saliphilus]
MKTFIVKLLSLVLLIGILTAESSQIQAEEEAVHKSKMEFNEVELTKQQLAELKTLHEDLMNQRIGVINKYVELGVLSEADGKEMKDHLDKYHKKLEEDGFIPKWDKHHGMHKHKDE